MRLRHMDLQQGWVNKELSALLTLAQSVFSLRRMFRLHVEVQSVVRMELFVAIGTVDEDWVVGQVVLHLFRVVRLDEVFLQRVYRAETQCTDATGNVVRVRTDVLVTVEATVKGRVADGTVERFLVLRILLWFTFCFGVQF